MIVTQDKALANVFRQMATGAFPPVVESFERNKTIFFPGDPAERVYFLLKGAVKLSRVYERLVKKLQWHCSEKIAFSAFCPC
jgi:CRP/FNR family transcriptional regulator, global nitrogen regulator